jgi:hypothetical protein
LHWFPAKPEHKTINKTILVIDKSLLTSYIVIINK